MQGALNTSVLINNVLSNTKYEMYLFTAHGNSSDFVIGFRYVNGNHAIVIFILCKNDVHME